MTRVTAAVNHKKQDQTHLQSMRPENTNANVHLLPLTPVDAPDVADLHLQIWQQAYAPIFGAERLQQLPAAEFRKVWQERLQAGDYQCLGIYAQEQLAGFCGWGDYSSSTAEIYHFYLHPDYWGQGVAEQAMGQLINRIKAAGYPEVLLWVLKANIRAQRFYQKWGFVPTGAEQQRTRYGLLLHEVQFRKTITA